jgi:hypothetical protein
VVSVENGEIQTHLTVDAAAGATVLTVESTHQFNNEPGDQVSIGGQAPIDVASTTDDTITLASPLVAAAGEGEPATLVRGGQPAQFWDAEVDFGEDETVPVPIVGLANRTVWAAGEYDPPVPVLVADDMSEILDAPGRKPIISDTVFQTSAAGARVELATISNPFELDQEWGLINLHSSNSTWGPGQIWAIFIDDTTDSGHLQISSPYPGGDQAKAASLTLRTDDNGLRQIQMDANTYVFGSGGTSVDFNLAGTSIFQVKGPDGRAVSFNYATLGKIGIGFADSTGQKIRGDLTGDDLHFNVTGVNSELLMIKAGDSANPWFGRGDLATGVQFAPTANRHVGWGGGWVDSRALAHIDMSDERYKDDVVPVCGALDLIDAVPAVDYVNSAGDEPRPGRGLVAQELAEHLPRATTGTGEEGDPMGVSPYAVAATAWAGVSELHALVKSLAAKVDALEARVAELEK